MLVYKAMSDGNANYSIRVYKQYFNFASSHFLMFEDGSREPLHGHNYRVTVKGEHSKLKGDMVFNFLDLKPIVRKICNLLDHRVLLPRQNENLLIESEGDNYLVIFRPDGSRFSFPKSDVLLLPVSNTSVERLASYLAGQISEVLWQKYRFRFQTMEVEVEETPGQSAGLVLQNRN